jgi:hypothetical protein
LSYGRLTKGLGWMVIFQASHGCLWLECCQSVDKLWNKPELSGDSKTQDVVFSRCERKLPSGVIIVLRDLIKMM